MKKKVHLLPTNDAEFNYAPVFKDVDGKTLVYNRKSENPDVFWKDCQYFHLYITTDDEIKEGDWCLFFWDGMKDGELGQVGSEPQQYLPSEGHVLNRNLRKIIATTDSELNLPQPSKAFIEEYCKVGGIDEIDVEYEDKRTDDSPTGYRFEPKVTSNNEIIIHPVKDSWTKEEVIDLFRQFQYDKAQQIIKQDSPIIPLDWIKENL